MQTKTGIVKRIVDVVLTVLLLFLMAFQVTGDVLHEWLGIEIPVSGGIDICGWTLERYEFRTHRLGGYSSMIQAGNRYTGGNREFFIPPSFFEGSFDEFLEKYNEMVPGAFGLDGSYLAKIPELKAFLGFEK